MSTDRATFLIYLHSLFNISLLRVPSYDKTFVVLHKSLGLDNGQKKTSFLQETT